MINYYDRAGKPIELADFGKNIEDKDYQVVQQDYTKRKKFWVSTVWLGLDHDFTWDSSKGPNPNPIIFETMVFRQRRGKRRQSNDIAQRRWTTEAEARAGHIDALAEWNDLEYQQSFRGHAARAFKAFWRVKVTPKNIPTMLWFAGLLSQFYRLKIPTDKSHLHLAQSLTLGLIIIALNIPILVQSLLSIRRSMHKMKWQKMELFVRSIITEKYLEQNNASPELIASVARIREQITKL